MVPPPPHPVYLRMCVLENQAPRPLPLPRLSPRPPLSLPKQAGTLANWGEDAHMKLLPNMAWHSPPFRQGWLSHGDDTDGVLHTGPVQPARHLHTFFGGVAGAVELAAFTYMVVQSAGVKSALVHNTHWLSTPS